MIGTTPEGGGLAEGGTQIVVAPGYEDRYAVLGSATSELPFVRLQAIFWYASMHDSEGTFLPAWCSWQAPSQHLFSRNGRNSRGARPMSRPQHARAFSRPGAGGTCCALRASCVTWRYKLGGMQFDANGRIVRWDMSISHRTYTYDAQGNLYEELDWNGDKLDWGTRWRHRYEGKPLNGR